MKLSVKVQDQHGKPQPNHHHNHNPLLLRAKIPVAVFGLPFLSSAAASTDSSDLSFSLRTNFSSGPAFKLSYTPNTAATAATAATATAESPFTLTLSSGVGIFGSPNNSPLIISAQFALSPRNPNPSTTFSFQIKPKFGDFSLRKTTSSSPKPSAKSNCEANSMGFVPHERPGSWKDLNFDSDSKNSVISGISVWANTALPVTKRVAMKLRWGVNFPSDFRKNLPFLSVNKIGFERIDELKEVNEGNKGNACDFELLKAMCVSVGRELESLQKENKEIRQCLDQMKFGELHRQDWAYKGRLSDSAAKKPPPTPPVFDNTGELELCKMKKGGLKDNPKSNSNRASNLENELQRAIKAASSQ